MKKYVLIALILLVIIGFSGYSISKDENTDHLQVSLAITKNYGKEVIQENLITVASGTSALEALKMITEVDTDYGGKFVSSINGIKSAYPDKNYDWFFYINGFLSKEGAASYQITNGDLIQWDYHSWESSRLQYAVLGCYPKYFINGYAGKISPTVIVFEEEFSNTATELKNLLTKKYSIDAFMRLTDEITEDEKKRSNIIILAKPNNKLILELNGIHEKIGFYAVFEGNVLIEFDYKDNPHRRYSKAGVIQLTQNIWNPKGNMACENVILLISGTDPRSIEKSATILLQDFEYRYSFGLIFTEQEIHTIPYCSEQ